MNLPELVPVGGLPSNPKPHEAESGRMRAIQRVVEVARTPLCLSDLLRDLRCRIRESLTADTAGILLLHTERAQPFAPESQDHHSQTVASHSLPALSAVARKVVAAGEARIVEDLSEWGRPNPDMEPVLASMMAAPLIICDRVIGVVHVASVKQRTFAQEELQLLQILADYSALAIENTRLREAEAERMRSHSAIQSIAGLLDKLKESNSRLAVATQRAEALAEEARRWATELDAVVEHTPARLALLDKDFNLVMVNSAFAAGAGRREDELVGRNYFAVFPDQQDREVFRRVRDSGEAYHFVEKPAHGLGNEPGTTYANVTLAPIADKTGGVDALLISMVDVTHQVRGRKQVQSLADEAGRRLAELDATIASIADGVLILDSEGRVSRLNPAVEAIMGFAPGDRAAPFAERMARIRMETADGRPIALDEVAGRPASTGKVVTGEILVVYRPDGRIVWVAASAAPIKTRRGKLLGSVITFTDVTPLRHLQEQQDDLIRAISHDLRSPLTVVLGHGQILYQSLSKGKVNLRRRRSADAIILAARQMNAMIRDLVDSARMEVGELELSRSAVDVAHLVTDLTARLGEVLETSRVRLDAPEGLPPVIADPDRLERILINLLTNALKYSDPETEVTVAVRNDGKRVVTSVTDRGKGIPPEELPLLFQRYGRTLHSRKRQDSLGLGLYITKGLVEAHGGNIWVESHVGVGSTFFFSLPIAP